MIQLTAQQQAVVENRGGGLLVSAAAGSGKTKVLVDRLFRYVMEEGCHVDDFLIITYTKAAAAELRSKIAAELARKLGEHPTNLHLRHQMLRVYQADIKTVDSFCTALLRENTHLLAKEDQTHALSPDFRVLDEGEALVLRQRVLARVLNGFYETLTPGGQQLADTLGAGRDDSRLADLVLELHGKIQSNAHPAQWLLTQRARWDTLPGHFAQTAYGQLLQASMVRQLTHWDWALRRGRAQWCDDGLEKGYGQKFDLAVLGFEKAASATNWDDLRMYVAEITFGRLSTPKGRANESEVVALKKIWEGAKACVKKLITLLEVSQEEAMEDLDAVAPAMVALVDLTVTFSQAYALEKRRRNVADFSDQEHFALALLVQEEGTPTPLGQQIAQRYREIMVDEYQDTNQVQNAIFSAVSRNEENLFMVGDVKQSIYRFRLADPTIFLAKYAAFAPHEDATEGMPRKILLSKNFRSRQSILDAANFIFEQVFSQEMGGIDYDHDQSLHFGASYYPQRSDCQTEYHLLPAQRKSQENPDVVKKAVLEAQFVAHRIDQMLKEGYLVTQGDGSFAPCQAEDFVILMRSPGSRSALYAAALAEVGVPCSFEEQEDFFQTMEISVALALLQVIDNPRQDVPLISLLRSPLLGFTPDRLAMIRGQTPKGDFYDALRQDSGDDVADFLTQLDALRLAAQDMSVHHLLWHAYNHFHMLGVFGAMDGGEARRENLIALTRHGAQFEASGYRGVFAFVNQLQKLMEQGKAPSTATATTQGVGLMSIHKSKGLEFPIVIVCDLDHKFSRMDFQTPVLVHPQLGLGPKRVDTQRKLQYATLARTALEEQIYQENLEEELRVLYVALTRPKEKLILVHSLYSAPKHLASLSTMAQCPVATESLRSAKCLGDWVLMALLCRPEAAPLLKWSGNEVAALYTGDTQPWQVFLHEQWQPEGVQTQAPCQDAPETQQPLSPLLHFAYPFQRETTLPAKITATSLKGRAIDAEIAENAPQDLYLRALRQPLFVQAQQGLTPAERGSATHLALQYLDFHCQDAQIAVETMVAQGRLTPQQGAAISIFSLSRLLKSPLADAIRNASNVWREFPFTVLVSAQLYDADAAPEEEIMLQGVVDCCYETPEGLTIVDFKTDHVEGDALDERAQHYRPQVDAYALALERVLQRPIAQKLLYFLHCNQTIPL